MSETQEKPKTAVWDWDAVRTAAETDRLNQIVNRDPFEIEQHAEKFPGLLEYQARASDAPSKELLEKHVDLKALQEHIARQVAIDDFLQNIAWDDFLEKLQGLMDDAKDSCNAGGGAENLIWAHRAYNYGWQNKSASGTVTLKGAEAAVDFLRRGIDDYILRAELQVDEQMNREFLHIILSHHDNNGEKHALLPVADSEVGE